MEHVVEANAAREDECLGQLFGQQQKQKDWLMVIHHSGSEKVGEKNERKLLFKCVILKALQDSIRSDFYPSLSQPPFIAGQLSVYDHTKSAISTM